MVQIENYQLEVVLDILEEYSENLQSQVDDLLHNGGAIKKDNSYSDSGTGYNLVSDVEYTEEYEQLTDKIESAKKLSKHFYKLI
jgi:predicted mannosyl-3-phosphoglycerate phosphatase (HAD superfamily)